MDSSTISILCVEFSRLPVESQNQEIGNLFTLAGGIQINRNSNESEEGFRNRTFEEGLKTITDGSEYKISFFENKIIPSLIKDFNHASVDAQERILDKLTELTDGALTERKPGKRENGFRARIYSQLLWKIPAGYEFEVVEFARQIGESKDENQYDQEDESDEYDDESSAARSDHSYRWGSEMFPAKGDSAPIDYFSSLGASEMFVTNSQPVQQGAWNDGSKIAGFNPKLKLKVKSKTNASPTSNS